MNVLAKIDEDLMFAREDNEGDVAFTGSIATDEVMEGIVVGALSWL